MSDTVDQEAPTPPQGEREGATARFNRAHEEVKGLLAYLNRLQAQVVAVEGEIERLKEANDERDDKIEEHRQVINTISHNLEVRTTELRTLITSATDRIDKFVVALAEIKAAQGVHTAEIGMIKNHISKIGVGMVGLDFVIKLIFHYAGRGE